MASAACESPLRRVAKDLANKGNSPVEVNRLKSLLRKKIGEDASTSSSPKKSATPRKEVKVKRGATVKLCSSCEHHNEEIKVKPRVDSQKESKVAKNVDEVARKTHVAKKKAKAEGQGQIANPADGASEPVEKKAAAKKPRERKKKAVTQGEKLGVPSTSGNVQSDSEGSALTDSGTAQAEGEAKPKHQRKTTKKSVQEESSVGKKKAKSKEVLKVKVAAPKKKTKNREAAFENMNVTDLVNPVHQEEDIQMQNTDGKSTMKSKSKKPGTGELANADETLAKQMGSSVDKATSKKETKAKGAVKPKVSRPKKSNKNIPFDNMDVTDLVTSIQQIEKQLVAGKPETSSRDAKSKATNTSKGLHVTFENSVTPGSTVADADEPSDNLEGSSVAKEQPKSKAKAKDATKVKSHLKKTTKNLPENNPNAGFEHTDVNDLVNSIYERKEVTEKSSSSVKNKLRKPANGGAHNTVNSITLNTTSNNLDKPSDNLKNNSHNKHFIQDSEDMFGENSISSIEKRVSPMNFSSDKTAPKNKSILNSSTSESCPQGDISHERNPLNMHGSFQGRLSDFNIETNFEEMPVVGIIGTSTGEMINLSSSTNLSQNDLEGHSMNLNNVDRSTNHPSIHNDETFYNGDFSSNAVHNIEVPANITLRTRMNKKKNQKDSSKSVAQENTSWNDGISLFTQKDRNDDMMTQKVSNKNDENQQSSTADTEHLTEVKPEPVDDFHGTSNQILPNYESSMPFLGSKETNLPHEMSHKKASKLAESKSKATKKSRVKTSKNVEPVGQKSKNSKKDASKESLKEPAQKTADKSVNKSSHQESESSPKKKSKARKNDEALCEKHEHSKKDDKKHAHRLAKEKKSDKQQKKDMKVAKAMAAMSEHFSRISIGTTIGTINELRIGKLFSDSDSSCDCSTDCSCSDYTSESNSSGGHCRCYRCLMKENDPSECEYSSSDDDNDDECSDESSSSESTSSASSNEEIRRPKRMCSTKGAKSATKPTYKEKLSKYCSKYDLRSHSSGYGLRSKDR